MELKKVAGETIIVKADAVAEQSLFYEAEVTPDPSLPQGQGALVLPGSAA